MSVTLEHVTRTVDGLPTIRDVSLTLERGTLSVLLGPTLSGKTSIMRLLAGLDRPTTGRVLVDGKDVTGADVRQRSVAMVYQQFINYPSLSVYENIASPLRVQGRPREEIDRRVQEAAKLLRLEPFLKRTPLQLSGGQQQRTAIARALVKGADLVLLVHHLGRGQDHHGKRKQGYDQQTKNRFHAFSFHEQDPVAPGRAGANTGCRRRIPGSTRYARGGARRP